MALDTPEAAAARRAGVCYIVVIVLGVAQAALVSARMAPLYDPGAVVADLGEESLRFGLGVLGDGVLYALVLVLAVALYALLRGVNRPLALGALVLRSAEAVTGLTATVVGGVGPLLLLCDPTPPDPDAVVALLAVRQGSLDVILVLVGLGGAAFCHLFLVARLVPAALALWGVFTYVSMVVLGASRILVPDLPASISDVLFTQGALFELFFGLWLVARAGDIGRRASTHAPSRPS